MDRSLDSIIGTRKRKDTPLDRSENTSELSPGRPAKVARHISPIDLGALLKPTNIPRDKFRKIQGLLNAQDQTIAKRGAEIKDRCTQIHGLKRELSEAHADIEQYRTKVERKHRQIVDLEKKVKEVNVKDDQDTVSVREYRERKHYYENFIEEQNQIMNLGRKVLADKNKQVQRLEEESRKLQVTVEERDATISSLNGQIFHMSMASADELAEAQAQRTLSMIKGLQSDIAERDVRIVNCEAEKSEAVSAKNAYKIQIDGMNKTVAAQGNALDFANKQAAEAKAITEDQAKLIQRLMEGNARLSANQKT